jgi:hypothetical protein
MMILAFPFFVVLDITVTIAACLFVNWWAPLLASKDGWLPNWMRWFQTFDNSLDAGWQIQGNYGTYLIDGTVPTGLTLYLYRVRWLYRNPAYGFSYWLLGVPFVPAAWKVVCFMPGSNLTFIARGPRGAFNVHAARLGWRFKLGWKAWNYFDLFNGWKSTPWGPEWRVPFVFSISRV